jgi:cobyrinic acid a,c-diamide synthase
LQSRHLGLVAADPATLDDQTLEALADACSEHVDLKALEELAGARRETLLDKPAVAPVPTISSRRVRIGIARDEAFHFYYPDNLEALELAGAELVPFSPLADRALPEDLAGLYFGGGYPEEHAERLSANAALREAVGRFAASGRCVHAECGGLMYLGRGLRARDGRRFPMTGVLPVETAMCGSVSSLGYAEVAFAGDSLWGPAGAVCRGHEFHYSEIVADDTAAAGWQPAYAVRRRRSEVVAAEGFSRGNVLAGYVHLHWASRPWAVAHFLARCAGCIVERERVK